MVEGHPGGQCLAAADATTNADVMLHVAVAMVFVGGVFSGRGHGCIGTL